MARETPWLTRKEAARRCCVSPATLAAYAASGPPPKGPPFWKPFFSSRNGATRYHRDLLDRWIAGDERVPSGLQTVYVEISNMLVSGGEVVETICALTGARSLKIRSGYCERGDWKRAEAEAVEILRILDEDSSN